MSASHHSTPLVRLGRLVLVVAMCASLGLHWAALQAVAWTQMLVTYSQRADFGEAVKKTFDGAHPCDICILVKDGQSGERKQSLVRLSKQPDAMLVREMAMPVQVARKVGFPKVAHRAAGWLEIPPVPPPRA